MQVYALTSNAEEVEAEWLYEDLQDLLEVKPKKEILFIIGDWNAKVGSQEIHGVTGKFSLGIQNEAAVLPLLKPGLFLHTFPINKGLMLCTLSSGLGGLLTFYDHFLIKVDQPENLFSLEVFFLYTSNLCQPQKVLNRVTFSCSKGAVGYKKGIISSKV